MVEHGYRSAHAIEIRSVDLRNQERFIIPTARMHNAVGTDSKTLADIAIVSSACTDDEHLVLYGTR